MKNKMALRDWSKLLSDVRSESEQSLQVVTAGSRGDVENLQKVFGRDADKVFMVPGDGAKSSSVKNADLAVLVLAGSAPIHGEPVDIARKSDKYGLEIIALIDEDGLSQAARQAKQVEAELKLSLSPARISFFSSKMTEDDKIALIARVLDRLEGKEIPLAARVPCFRNQVVRKVVDEVAGQNAILGITNFIPGADMPVLTANQIRMVLKIAATFGATLSLKRAKELLFVIGGGFTFRAIARQLIGVVPIAGWAVKGAVAYSGTRAVGKLAQKYFAEVIDDEERKIIMIEPGQKKERRS